MSSSVTRLKVDDEAFLVASTIDRCPKIAMMRELLQNAIEAAMLAPTGQRRVFIDTVEIDSVRKLRMWNTGTGMDEPGLHKMCDLSSAIGKMKGLDGNFGMGAKVATLPSNHLGVRYRSCRFGMVHEVMIGKRDGVYGRVRRPDSGRSLIGAQRLTDIVEVTALAREDRYDLTEDWTEVVLMGMRAEQDTAADPYDGDPAMPEHWLPRTLYERFFRVPAGIEVRISPDFHEYFAPRLFETLHQRALTAFAGYEAVSVADGVTVHFFHDKPSTQRPWLNASSDGAMQTSPATVGLVFRNEIYDLQTGSPWSYDAPNYGITFGARNISVYIELPDDHPVLPDIYRQFLHHRRGTQAPVSTREFTQLVMQARPRWLVEAISAIGGKSEVSKTAVDRLGALCQLLNLDAMSDDATADPTVVASNPVSPSRAACGFDIILLHDERDINDRWLLGRAACFYPETKQLFVNTRYKAVETARELLRLALADADPREELKELIIEAAVEAIVYRVGRALLFGMSKHLDTHDWQPGHIEKAMSPESLSIAADDFYDLLPAAEREVRERLRNAELAIPTSMDNVNE